MNDMYADAAPPAQDTRQPNASTQKEDASDSQTAELPKSVLGGKDLQPGEEVVLKVVKVLEDSVLVSYASDEHEEEPEEAEPPQQQAAPQAGSMASMMG